MNGYSNARNLAKLYGIVANGGKTKEGVLISQKTIETLKQPLTSGDSLDKIINLPFGYGLVVMPDERVRTITGFSTVLCMKHDILLMHYDIYAKICNVLLINVHNHYANNLQYSSHFIKQVTEYQNICYHLIKCTSKKIEHIAQENRNMKSADFEEMATLTIILYLYSG